MIAAETAAGAVAIVTGAHVAAATVIAAVIATEAVIAAATEKIVAKRLNRN